MNKHLINKLLVAGIFFLGLFLRIDRLSTLMPFIGDAGWFYLSAKNALISHSIPLVGITASHTWLHQGSFWTYILMILFLFSQNPVIPAFFTAIVGSLGIIFLYIITKKMFSPRVGLIASLLYATSPLIIFSARMPYHTSLISFFVILLMYALFLLSKNKKYALPFIFFLLGILYNLELATVSLFAVVLIYLIYPVYKTKQKINFILLILSFIAFSLPMMPIYIYDVHHKFAQTFTFAGWILYHLVVPSRAEQHISPFLYFLEIFTKRLIFAPSIAISIALLIFSLIAFGMQWKKIKTDNSYLLLFLIFVIPLTSIILSRTPSEAYLPMLFPSITILLALLFDYLWQQKYVKYIAIILLATVTIGNSIYIYSSDYYTSKKKVQEGYIYTPIKNISSAILTIQKYRKQHIFTIKGEDFFAISPTSLDAYQYEASYLGLQEVKNTKPVFYIYPTDPPGLAPKNLIYNDEEIKISLYEK